MRRLALLLVLLAALVVPTAAEAKEDSAGSGVGGAADGSIWAGVQYSKPPSGGADGQRCTWKPETTYDSGLGHAGNITKTHDGIRYRLYVRRCPTGSSLVWVAEISARDLAIQAANAIRQRLPAPRGAFAPAADRGIVHLGMWFWTDPSTWRPVSVTAWTITPRGVIWATTTATPARLVYLPGDGSAPVACPGPGLVWTPDVGDVATSPCMHTYRHASVTRPGGVYLAELGIDWAISWTSNVGRGGALPGWRTTSRHLVRVDEIHALVATPTARPTS